MTERREAAHRVDPAVITLKSSQRAEMPVLRCDHTWHASHGLKENQTEGNGVCRGVCCLVSGDEVEGPIGELQKPWAILSPMVTGWRGCVDSRSSISWSVHTWLMVGFDQFLATPGGEDWACCGSGRGDRHGAEPETCRVGVCRAQSARCGPDASRGSCASLLAFS